MASPRDAPNLGGAGASPTKREKSGALDQLTMGDADGDAFHQLVGMVISPNQVVPTDAAEETQANQVSVKEGIEVFNATEQQLQSSVASDPARPPTATKAAATGRQEMSEVNASKQDTETRVQQVSPGPDLETGAPQKQFDLKEFLEASLRMRTEAGIKRAQMGVVFKNLTVVGEGAGSLTIDNIFSPIGRIIKSCNPLSWGRKTKLFNFDILHDVTGFVEEGKMLLVLGRPGAGCSTLLKVLANRREGYVGVHGNVTYGGIPAPEFEAYADQAIYTAEEDVHFPVLTVKETLDFALKTKTPAIKTKGMTDEVFRERVLYMLTNMFGLTKQIQTMVGNEFIRGLSGGERKRLTISEAMTARACINCWDCTTRGLDAASALDYTKALRIMSDTLQKTTVATFYQAGEDMYSLFDDVMVLDKGRCIYYGPVQDAKPYFEALGFRCEARKSTPDFLTGITNANERKIKPGFEDKVPTTTAQMEAAWLASAAHARLLERLRDYEGRMDAHQPDFRASVAQQKAKGSRAAYQTNFVQQTAALMSREWQLIKSDRGALIGRAFSVLTKAFIYATVFFNMQATPAGAFERGGALFASVLFNSLISLSELPNALRARRVLHKQKTYSMYHPSAQHFAVAICDVPIVLLQTIVFAVCAYWIFGLYNSAKAFFTYWITLALISLTMTEVFRLTGAITKTYFAASQISGSLLIMCLCYTGFTIPFNKMHPWLSWYYWINPMSYAYKGIFSNEMENLTFPCVGPAGVVPYDPNGVYRFPYQTCLMAGGQPGATEVSGADYLKAYYGYDVNDKALDIGATFLWWLFYIIVNCLTVEFVSLGGSSTMRQVYKRGKAPKMNAADEAPAQGISGANKGADKFATGSIFTWQHIDYTVPVKGGERQLLDKVEGWIKPGSMTALMGSSGAGKTTLLDVLARRKTIGRIEGEILLNGDPLRVDFDRITGYIEQMDVCSPAQTVRESLQFSARMRQDASVPLAEKYEYVEQVLEMMEMTHLGDALVGDLESGRGISVEERKRLTIGMELVGRPSILFLDEPTSGLDAQSAYNVVKFIRKLADNGMPLVCTIHQPSSVLFEYFDRLLLLARGGKTVYFGDIGEKSGTLGAYFERHGARALTQQENPAEYILEVIGAGTAGHTDVDWPAIWKGSSECKAVDDELNQIAATSKAKHEKENATLSPKERAKKAATSGLEFATTEAYQLWEVYKRLNVFYWRDPNYNMSRFLNAAFVGLIDGFSFWQLGNSTSDLQSRIFATFQILMLGNSLILLAQPQLMKQRTYFRREYASKFYGWRPFAISMVLVELPYLVVSASLFVFCAYWTAGLETTPVGGLYFWLMLCLYCFFTVSFGQAIAGACQTLVQASVVNPFFNSILILFAGVLNPPQSLPKFYSSWLYWLDPYHWMISGLMVDVLHDQQIVCSEDDFKSIRLPPGISCGTYMDPYMAEAGGYLEDPSAMGTCRYCQYKTGDEYLAVQYQWDISQRWRNFGIFAAYFVFNIGLVVFFIWLFRKQKR